MSAQDVSRVRLAVLGVVIVGLFAALFARLYYLQVLVSPTFVVQAEQNQVREVRLPPVRGRILDRNGVVLADNVLIGEVALDRDVMRTLDSEDRLLALAQRLSPVIGLTTQEILDEYYDLNNHPLLPVVLIDGVDDATLTFLKERQAEFPGVIARQVQRRVYPLGPVASHVIGYVGEIPQNLLDADVDGVYAPGDEVGKAGVEQIFESDLRGANGLERYEVDRRNFVVGRELIDDTVPGADIVLTIDTRLQVVAERALETGLLNARRGAGEFNATRPAPAGSVVVLDITDGSVVAMASFPYFDPNDFIGGISTDTWERITRESAYAPLNNRAIQGLYAPGSTFKPFTAIAGLESGVIDLGTTLYDPGFYTLDPCEGEKCEWTNAGTVEYGWVGLSRSLVVSSDVYYYSMGADIQVDLPDGEDEVIQDVAAEFGFGSETGIQLPFERRGQIPTEELKQELFEAGVFEFGTWFVGDTINLAIGQGELLVTPLQLANAYATLANRGELQQPNIVAEVLDRPEGDAVRSLGTRTAADFELDVPNAPATWETILGGLVGAVSSGEGTADEAFVGFDLNSFRVAGKTGTAQQFGRNPVTQARREDTALFVGYAPAFDPQYVVAVVLEEAGFGGEAAAPVAREVFDAIVELERTGDIVDPEEESELEEAAE
ncbi:MAG: penicillin-binding protein 2 [Actinomycetota bacterium]